MTNILYHQCCMYLIKPLVTTEAHKYLITWQEYIPWERPHVRSKLYWILTNVTVTCFKWNIVFVWWNEAWTSITDPATGLGRLCLLQTTQPARCTRYKGYVHQSNHAPAALQAEALCVQVLIWRECRDSHRFNDYYYPLLLLLLLLSYNSEIMYA